VADPHPGPGVPTHVIQGRTVGFPVEVRDASSGAATYLVSSAAARRWLPGDALELVEPLPGRALLSLAVVDYRDNDLGDYHEVSVALFVRRRGASRGLPWLSSWVDLLGGRLGTYIHWLPVDQTFTCEAGREIWGFPKTVDEIEIEAGEGRCTCTWWKEGHHVLSLSLPRGGSRSMPETAMTTYSVLHGVPHATRFVSAAEGMGFALGGADLRLGEHPVAEELRSLGLPRRALFTTWMERMRSRFDPPEKL
jgi:hypothetical protein